VVVLSNNVWQRRYGKDPEVLGRAIIVNDVPYTVIGVLPPEIDFEMLWRDMGLMAPAAIDPTDLKRDARRFTAVGRLKDDVTLEQAQAEMTTINANLAQAYPETNAETDMWLESFEEFFMSPEDRWAMRGLLAAVGLVLVIACVNLANLLLAKTTSRSREFAVRAALGAGRGRIIRQLFIESLLLALGGGIFGLLLALWAVDLMIINLEYIPYQRDEVGLNPAVLTYTLLISMAAALFFGLFPALTSSKVSLHEELKEGQLSASAGRSRNRLRNGLVMGQLAVAIPLLVCCSMITKHLIGLKNIDFGYNSDNVITMQVDLPTYRYNLDEQWTNFYRQTLSRVNEIPGVENVAATLSVPVFTSSFIFGAVTIEGRSYENNPEEQIRGYQLVTANFFETLEAPLISGRFFTEMDHAESQPVAVINQRMAQQQWPNEDPLGKRFTFDPEATPTEWVTIVGVVADIGKSTYGGPPRAALYIPHQQKPQPSMVLIARTTGDPMDMIQPIRSTIHSFDSTIPIYNFQTIEDMAHRWLRDDRMAAWFFGGLALLALSLACIGLYGIMSYSVAQRTNEIGIRVAFGAVRKDILNLVLKRCLKLAGMGILIGLVLSIPVSVLLASFLYRVSRIDPISFGAVIILFLAVSMLAGYFPARRATRINPLTALRYE